MGIPLIGDIVDEVGETVRHLIPSKKDKQAFDLEMARIKDAAEAREVALQQGQIETNKIEAAHKSVFVAGWRPGLGWVGVAGAAVGFVVVPLGQMATAWWRGLIVPDYPMENLLVLITWMLGQSGIRSFDLLKGTASKTWNGKKEDPNAQTLTVTAPADAQIDAQVNVPPVPAEPNFIKLADEEELAPWNLK